MGKAGWPSDAGAGHNGWALEPRAGAKTTGQQGAGWEGSRKINCSEETARANSSAPAERHAKAGPETAARSRGADKEPPRDGKPRAGGEREGREVAQARATGGLSLLDCSWPCRLNAQPGRGCPLLLRRAGQPGEGSLGSPLREGLAASAEPCQRHEETAGGIRWSLQKWRGRRNYSEVTEREMPGGGRSGGRPALREPARLSPALQAHARQPGTQSRAEKQSQGQAALPAHRKQGCVSITSPGGSRSLPRAPQGSSGSALSFLLHKAQARSHGPPLEEGQATDLAGKKYWQGDRLFPARNLLSPFLPSAPHDSERGRVFPECCNQQLGRRLALAGQRSVAKGHRSPAENKVTCSSTCKGSLGVPE